MEAGRFTFSDDCMFARVMSDEGICRRVLERILGVEVERIVYQHGEHAESASLFAKDIRMDVYLEGSDAVYDVEMQSYREPSIGRRLRYYQSVIDAGLLSKGNPYEALSESYVIFICKEDPFRCGLPVYTIERSCAEDASVEVGCGSHWLALNASAFGREKDAAVRNLLEYVSSATVAEGDGLIEDIDRAVHAANHDKRWVDAMFYVSGIIENAERRARSEGRREGLAEGREEGREEGILAGMLEGEARYGELVSRLADAGRLQDAAAASKDPRLLEDLFAEFGI